MLLVPMRVLRKLLPLVRHTQLIHFHDIDLLPWMAIISLFRPTVYDIHENYADEMLVKDWMPSKLRGILYHMVYRAENFLTRIIQNAILVSPSQEAKFKHLDLQLLEVRNYATVKLLSKALPDDYMHRDDLIVFSGSNYESNGSTLLLDIASRLRMVRPKVKFLIVDRFASVKYRAFFLAERDRRGLINQVHMTPNLLPHELMTILNRGTIGLAPNLRAPKQVRALPTKLFEYMAASLPIISSDLPYPSQLFADERFGLLAQPEDSESFVRAIIRLVDDRRLSRQMGEAGRAAFEAAFSWESQIPALLNYYRQIIAA